MRDVSFPADEALDEQGLAACASWAGKPRRIDLALSSPALCARQTALALALEAQIEPGLREIDYGRWAGRTLDDVGSADTAGTAAWLSDTSSFPHGGESIDALLARVGLWLAALPQDDRRIVAVTHASVMRAALLMALQAPASSFWRIDVAPLSLLRLRGANGRWTLLSLGR